MNHFFYGRKTTLRDDKNELVDPVWLIPYGIRFWIFTIINAIVFSASGALMCRQNHVDMTLIDTLLLLFLHKHLQLLFGPNAGIHLQV